MRHGLAFTIILFELAGWVIKCSIIVLVLCVRIPLVLLALAVWGRSKPKHVRAYAVPVEGEKNKYVLIPRKSWWSGLQEGVDQLINPTSAQPTPAQPTSETSQAPIAFKLEETRNYNDLVAALTALGEKKSAAEKVARYTLQQLGDVPVERSLKTALDQRSKR